MEKQPLPQTREEMTEEERQLLDKYGFIAWTHDEKGNRMIDWWGMMENPFHDEDQKEE